MEFPVIASEVRIHKKAKGGFPFIILLMIAGLCASCDKSPQTGQERESKAASTSDEGKISLYVDGIPVKVEVCDTPESRGRGLMFREHLPPDEGMLFVFENEGYHSFWMKNTYIPLSIAFIDRNKEIVQIEDMEPLNTETLHTPSKRVLYALEMNRGWFERNNVKVGDRVEFEWRLFSEGARK